MDWDVSESAASGVVAVAAALLATTAAAAISAAGTAETARAPPALVLAPELALGDGALPGVLILTVASEEAEAEAANAVAGVSCACGLRGHIRMSNSTCSTLVLPSEGCWLLSHWRCSSERLKK